MKKIIYTLIIGVLIANFSSDVLAATSSSCTYKATGTVASNMPSTFTLYYNGNGKLSISSEKYGSVTILDKAWVMADDFAINETCSIYGSYSDQGCIGYYLDSDKVISSGKVIDETLFLNKFSCENYVYYAKDIRISNPAPQEYSNLVYGTSSKANLDDLSTDNSRFLTVVPYNYDSGITTMSGDVKWHNISISSDNGFYEYKLYEVPVYETVTPVDNTVTDTEYDERFSTLSDTVTEKMASCYLKCTYVKRSDTTKKMVITANIDQYNNYFEIYAGSVLIHDGTSASYKVDMPSIDNSYECEDYLYYTSAAFIGEDEVYYGGYFKGSDEESFTVKSTEIETNYKLDTTEIETSSCSADGDFQQKTYDAVYGCAILGDHVTEWVKWLITILRVIVPVGIVILTILDFLKIVGSGEDKEYKAAIQKLIKRIVIAVAIFVVPALVALLIDLSGILTQYGITDDIFCSLF